MKSLSRVVTAAAGLPAVSSLVVSVTAASLLACGGAPPDVPPAEPVGAECRMIDPPADVADPAPAAGTGRFLPAPGPALGQKASGQTASEQPSKGVGLKGLRPQGGIHPATPVRFEQILVMRHPPSAMQWRALPAGSDARLVEVIGDADSEPLVRVRAMEGLSVRAPEDGHAPLAAVLADAKAEPALRRGAARALGRGYADSAEAPGTAALVAALDADDTTLREAVVKALAPRAGDPAVRAALEARAAVEAEVVVKEALGAALATGAAGGE